MALRVEGIKYSYGQLKVLDGISFAVAEGEFVCMVGPSGCGKTTLLRVIAGLNEPSEGEVTWNGTRIELSRGQVGFVFQEDSLFPWRTVLGNVEFGMEGQKLPKGLRRQAAERYLAMVGLGPFARYYPRQLSGGMKQLAAIARALVYDPRLILMDEPFAFLDAQTRNGMQGELLRIWQESRKTVLFVTHSMDEAVFLAERVIVLTGRPARVKAEVVIELGRPRIRTSPEFNHFRQLLLGLVASDCAAGPRDMG